MQQMPGSGFKCTARHREGISRGLGRDWSPSGVDGCRAFGAWKMQPRQEIFRPGHCPPARRVASYGLAAIHSHFRSPRSHPTVLQGGDQMSIRCAMCLAFEVAQSPGGLSQGDRSIHKVPAHEPGHGLVIPNRMLKNTPSGLSAQPRACLFRHKFFLQASLFDYIGLGEAVD